MNFNFPLLRPIRILLFPISLIYALIILVRNWCYDRKIFSSTSFNLPIICVGNVAVGGTRVNVAVGGTEVTVAGGRVKVGVDGGRVAVGAGRTLT